MEDEQSGECEVCQKTTTFRCQFCGTGWFCSTECQSQGWQSHISSCTIEAESSQESNEEEEEGLDGEIMASSSSEDENVIIPIRSKKKDLSPIRKIQIRVVFHNHRENPITKFTVKVPRFGNISDLRREISILTGISSSKLLFVEYYQRKIYCLFLDSDLLRNIKDHDLVIAYEMVNEREEFTNFQELVLSRRDREEEEAIFDLCFRNMMFGQFVVPWESEISYYTYFGRRTEKQRGFKVLFDTHFFLPLYHHQNDNNRRPTTSKDIYDLCLDKTIQFFPKEYIEKLLTLGFDLCTSDYSKRKEYFPTSSSDPNVLFEVLMFEEVQSYNSISLHDALEGNKKEPIRLLYDQSTALKFPNMRINEVIEENSSRVDDTMTSKRSFQMIIVSFKESLICDLLKFDWEDKEMRYFMENKCRDQKEFIRINRNDEFQDERIEFLKEYCSCSSDDDGDGDEKNIWQFGRKRKIVLFNISLDLSFLWFNVIL